MRTIVIEGLERVGPATNEDAHWLIHGYVKGKLEVRVTVELIDGEGKWRGSNVIGQLMDGDTQEVEVDLQQQAVWISIQGAESTKPARYLGSRKS
jgi:hypothetical protein